MHHVGRKTVASNVEAEHIYFKIQNYFNNEARGIFFIFCIMHV